VKDRPVLYLDLKGKTLLEALGLVLPPHKGLPDSLRGKSSIVIGRALEEFSEKKDGKKPLVIVEDPLSSKLKPEEQKEIISCIDMFRMRWEEKVILFAITSSARNTLADLKKSC